jgi:murein DD-endopeptidase MepM/ murein hydrolase activator NlpD
VLGGRTEQKLSQSAEPTEASIVIPVPPPRTQLIKKVPPVTTLRPVTKVRNLPIVVTIPPVQPGMTTLPSDSNTPNDPTASSSGQVAIYPLLNPAPVTSRFGWRTHPLTGTRRFHSGVDIGAPLGAPVVATVSGTIVSAGWNGGYGKAVTIEQPNGLRQTLYGHLSEISVQAGQ